MATPGDVKEDADADERDDEAGPAVGHERQRDSGQRREPQHSREVDRRLAADERGEPGGEPLSERILAVERDFQARPREEGVGQDDDGRADEAQLLADHGEDHVGVRLGQVVDLLHALAEPVPEEAAGAEPDLRLHDLEAGARRRVQPRS